MTHSTQFPLSRIGLISGLVIFGAFGALATSPLHHGDTLLRPTSDPVSIRATIEGENLQRAGKWHDAAYKLSEHNSGDNPRAKFLLAYQTSRGWGTSRDLDKALELLLQSVQYDFPERARAAFELGKLYRLSRGKDCQKLAFHWFSKALQWGNSKAHLELAKSYARGLGTDLNFQNAAEHYRKAAELGSAPALISWITMVDKGVEGTPGNRLAALEILNEFKPVLESQAKSGSAVAARSLGRLYIGNQIVKEDHNQARAWLEMASTLGDGIAMHDLAKLTLDNEYDWFTQEHLLGLMHTSAKAGYPAAYTLLGRLHLSGELGLNSDEAVKWFNKGVNAGHAGSMEELARMHWTGEIRSADPQVARNLAKQGAKLRHSGCIKLLQKIDNASKIQTSQLAAKD